MSLIRYQGHLDFFRPMQPGEALEWLIHCREPRQDRSRRSAMRTAYRAKTRRRNRRRK